MLFIIQTSLPDNRFVPLSRASSIRRFPPLFYVSSSRVAVFIAVDSADTTANDGKQFRHFPRIDDALSGDVAHIFHRAQDCDVADCDSRVSELPRKGPEIETLAENFPASREKISPRFELLALRI